MWLETLTLAGVIVIIASAIINRAAGSNLFGLKDKYNLPIRALLWTTVPMGFLAHFVFQDVRQSVAWVLAFYCWRVWAWGRYIDLNTLPDDYNRVGVALNWHERFINSISFGLDALALFWRHFFALIPGFLLLHYMGIAFPYWTAPAFALILTSCYAWAKGVWFPRDFIWLAEILSGIAWGMLLMTTF